MPVNLLFPATQYFTASTGWAVNASDLTFSGTQISWDPDGYSVELPFVSAGSGGLDGSQSDTFHAAITLSGASYDFVMAIMATGYSGRWVTSLPVACADGVIANLNVEYTPFADMLRSIAFIPWHTETNQPLVSYLGSNLSYALTVSALSFGIAAPPPLFWTELIKSTQISA